MEFSEGCLIDEKSEKQDIWVAKALWGLKWYFMKDDTLVVNTEIYYDLVSENLWLLEVDFEQMLGYCIKYLLIWNI